MNIGDLVKVGYFVGKKNKILYDNVGIILGNYSSLTVKDMFLVLLSDGRQVYKHLGQLELVQ